MKVAVALGDSQRSADGKQTRKQQCRGRRKSGGERERRGRRRRSRNKNNHNNKEENNKKKGRKLKATQWRIVGLMTEKCLQIFHPPCFIVF